MKNKTLLVVLGVLLVVVMGVSFAYFAVNVSIGGTGGSTNLGTSNFLKVEYDAGTSKLEASNMFPKDIVRKDFKVIVTPTTSQKEVTYRIYMNITTNTFEKCTDSNYNEATNKCEKDANEIVYRLKDSNGNIIKEGDLTGSVTGEIEILRETKTQETRTEYTYTIEIEYKDTNKEQNHNTNKVINGEIKVEFAEEGITIPDIIAKSTKGSGTPNFSNTSCTSGCEETTVGTYTASDGMYGGTSTYWRGDPTDNYVKFADKCWRIVRINGDGSMRLIYDGSTCHANGTSTEDSIAVASVAYNTSYNQSNYVGWTYTGTSQRTLGGTASNAKTQLESWYSSNIGNNTTYVSKIADGKYCNDRDVASGSSWNINGNPFYYAGHDRLYNEYQSKLSCNSSDVYMLKVGLITADEVTMAGSKWTSGNSLYYLYNGQYYWTMSPYDWSTSGYAQVFYVDSTGYLYSGYVHRATRGLRPVINLKADTIFNKDGKGTLEKPYVVK